MASAAFTINGALSPQETTAGATVTLALLSSNGVGTVEWTIIGGSDSTQATPTITPGGSPLGATATFTMNGTVGSVGLAWLIQCRINGGVNSTGQVVASYTATGLVGVVNTPGILPFAVGESFERNPTHGIADDLNEALALAVGGGGGGGGTSLWKYFGSALTARTAINALDGVFAEDDPVGLQTSLSTFDPPRVTCAARTTSNFNLASPPNHTFDSYTLLTYDVVWLDGQTTTAENGFYWYTGLAGAAGFQKLSSLDDITAANGVNVLVRKGTSFGGKFFRKKTGSTAVQIRDAGRDHMKLSVDSFYLASDGDDISPAIRRAQDAVELGGTITFGRRLYRMQTTVQIVKAMWLEASGAGLTTLYSDQTAFDCVSTNTSNLPVFATPGASGFKRLLIINNSGTSTTASDKHGITSNKVIYVDDCAITGFPGNAINIVAFAITGDPARGGIKGNANGWRVVNCFLNDIGRNGLFLKGTDANAGYSLGCSIAHCGKRNIANDCVITGSVDLTTLTLPGDITGKTLVLTVNSGTLRTVTFTGASTTPANLVGEINTAMAADAAFTASLDGSNHLVLTVTPPAGGPHARLDIGTSTSLATLGLVTGINDGDTHAWGYFDDSFLGNAHYSNQTTTNTSVYGGGHRLAGTVTQAIAFNPYSETEHNYVEFPSMVVGGNLGNQQCPRARGVIPQLSTTGGTGSLLQTGTAFAASGTNAVRMLVCQAGTDVALQFTRTGDTTGISFQYDSGTKEWWWAQANSAGAIPLSFTGPGHSVGSGFPIARRGVYVGGYRWQALAKAGLPATNGNHNTLTSDFWAAAGAMVWHNPDHAPGVAAWSYLSAGGGVDGGALTWKTGGYIPYDAVAATPNFGTLTTLTGGTATVTVTGAAVGDRVHVQKDGTWSSDGLILNSARVTGANTVTIYVFNATAGTYNGGGAQTEAVKVQVSKMS